MPKYNITEETPPEYPTHERIERLKSIGIQTDGQIDKLKEIMAKKGLELPEEWDGGYKFHLQDEKGVIYTFIYQTDVDACAEKLLKTIE